MLRQAQRRIDRLQPTVRLQQRQPRQPEQRVKDVRHVAVAIAEAARFRVLARQNELLQLLRVDPVQPAHDRQR